jgi:hypothetical protein
MEVSDQFDAPAALALEKSQRYALDSRLGGPQSRCGRCEVKENLLLLPGIEPQPTKLFRLSSRCAGFRQDKRPGYYLRHDIQFKVYVIIFKRNLVVFIKIQFRFCESKKIIKLNPFNVVLSKNWYRYDR